MRIKSFGMYLFFCLINFSTLFCLESRIVSSRNCGFFSIFMDVVAAINSYEQGRLKGLSINFGTSGLYYDPQHGENWWEYYFEPLCVGDMSPPVRTTSGGNEFYLPLSNEIVNTCIQKYVRPKPHINQKIQKFIARHFAHHYVIGVHYRGTDKRTEAGRVTHEKMINALRRQVENTVKQGHNNYVIFLATDEQKFLDLVREVFPNRVCCINAYRANDDVSPVHTNAQNNRYKLGEEALLDCLLLSKTNFLLRTSSNLNTCSLYFNPKLASRGIGA